jgi:hypothetical protein
MKDTNEIITNAKQLADNLQNTASCTNYSFSGMLWDSAAMLRVLCDKLQDFSTESTALRATEMNLEAEIESLRAQLSQRVPDALQQFICHLIDNEEGGIISEEGLQHSLADMLSAAPSQQAPVAQGEPVAWKHDCAALLQNDVELWVERCPHCGKPKDTTPQQASKPMTDEIESALEALVNRCNNDAGLTNDEAVIAAEATLERLYKARAVERHHKIGEKQ